jgi:hypothetical protein
MIDFIVFNINLLDEPLTYLASGYTVDISGSRAKLSSFDHVKYHFQLRASGPSTNMEIMPYRICGRTAGTIRSKDG